MSERIRRITYQSAAALVEALRLTRSQWCEGECTWLFRGHADARWLLRPTAFRPASWLAFGGLPDGCGSQTGDIERGELLWFAQGLDRAGLSIPGASRAQIDEWTASSMDTRTWIRKLAELMALAQHHGFPTRLLDFTYQSLVAAYFAALPLAMERQSGARQPGEKAEEETPEELCVWAVDSTVVRVREYVGEKVPPGKWCDVVRASRSGNDHLRAQDGAFVVWENEELTLDDLIESIDPDPYRQYLDPAKRRTGPTAFQLVLPRAEAPQLLGLLARERITGARLFPGPQGVIRERKEQTQHRVFPSDRNTKWPTLLGFERS